jgi:hypothetical protein
VTFADGDGSQAVTIGTRDDRRTEKTRTFTVALGGFTGSLQAGTPATATVAVLDDDPRVRVRSAGAGRVRLKADRAGRFTLRGRGLRTAHVRLKHARTRTVRLRPKAGAPRRSRVTARFNPSGVGRTVTTHRTLRLT